MRVTLTLILLFTCTLSQNLNSRDYQAEFKKAMSSLKESLKTDNSSGFDYTQFKDYFPSDLKKLQDQHEEHTEEVNQNLYKMNAENKEFMKKIQEETQEMINGEVQKNAEKIIENIMNHIKDKEPTFLKELNEKFEKAKPKLEKKLDKLKSKIEEFKKNFP